jgi:hypothetical protein
MLDGGDEMAEPVIVLHCLMKNVYLPISQSSQSTYCHVCGRTVPLYALVYNIDYTEKSTSHIRNASESQIC